MLIKRVVARAKLIGKRRRTADQAEDNQVRRAAIWNLQRELALVSGLSQGEGPSRQPSEERVPTQDLEILQEGLRENEPAGPSIVPKAQVQSTSMEGEELGGSTRTGSEEDLGDIPAPAPLGATEGP